MLLLMCAMLVLVAIPSASAVYTAELTSPSDISNVYNGDTVTIKLTNVQNTDTFQLNMTSSNLYASGGMFTITNFAMPFSMSPATTLLTADKIDATKGLKLHVQGSGSTTKDYSTTTSPYIIYTTDVVNQQTYKDISITGYPVTPGQPVTIDFSERGTVTSTPGAPVYLSFTVQNLNGGQLKIIIKDATDIIMDTTLSMAGTHPVPIEGGSGGGSSGSTGTTTTGSKNPSLVAPVDRKSVV